MWDKVSSELVKYPSAVISWIDITGYPTSIRCELKIDPFKRVLRLPSTFESALQAGPASLLCHSHDDKLATLNNFNARGILEQDAQGWLFRPTTYIPGASSHPIGMLRFILGGRRAARLYLQKRGLKPPEIAWHEFQRLYKKSRHS